MAQSKTFGVFYLWKLNLKMYTRRLDVKLPKNLNKKTSAWTKFFLQKTTSNFIKSSSVFKVHSTAAWGELFWTFFNFQYFWVCMRHSQCVSSKIVCFAKITFLMLITQLSIKMSILHFQFASLFYSERFGESKNIFKIWVTTAKFETMRAVILPAEEKKFEKKSEPQSI